MMEQRSKEWLAIRKKHVTSTDAGPILGVCKYRTPYQVWAQKFDLIPSEEENDAMRWGQEQEPIALKIFNEKTGNNMVPACKFNGFQMASLDGYDPIINEGLELKCPYQSEYNHLITKKGKVPQDHLPQIAHGFLTVKCEFWWFGSYFKGDFQYLRVDKNIYPSSYFDNLQKAESEFYELMKSIDTPPEMTNRDYVTRSDEEFQNLVINWRQNKNLMDYYSGLEKNYRVKLKEVCHNQNAKGCGVTISKVIRKGAIEYDRIPEIASIDLESYRKPHIEYWSIKQEKE